MWLSLGLEQTRVHTDIPIHPGIVSLFGKAVEGDSVYFVMAKAETSLAGFIQAERNPTPGLLAAVVTWAYQITAALTILHEHYIIHG